PVTVAMRTVGLLLVSALMVVPVATAQQLSRGFRATLVGAMIPGCLASVAGLLISAYVDVAPGATIVLLTLAGFALTWPVGAYVRRRRRLASPFPADPVLVVHEHHSAHAAAEPCAWPDCCHRAVPLL